LMQADTLGDLLADAHQRVQMAAGWRKLVIPSR
jgi:hypothetical protein